MIGDPGPYIEIDGPGVWVPRTVPWRKAWDVAREAIQEWGDVLRYRGKEDATLNGFTLDCRCEEVCERTLDENGEPNGGDGPCKVPAWHFEIVERGEP